MVKALVLAFALTSAPPKSESAWAWGSPVEPEAAPEPVRVPEVVTEVVYVCEVWYINGRQTNVLVKRFRTVPRR